MSLFRELKRRNVFRVGAAYLVIAWLIIQVVETLFPVFELSNESIRLVVLVLVFGFLPALVLAWVFVVSLFAIFAFASFMQGFFADDCNWLERIVLLAVSILMFRPALVADDIGIPRELIQAVALVIYFALYFYQKRRRKQREPGAPAAQAG